MNPLGNFKHGGHGTITYSRWKSMRQRTGKKKGRHHNKYYGGVECCARWSSYTFFLADMGECPSGYTLERENNDLGYQPGNCRWAPKAEQAGNRRNCVILTHQGLSLNVAQWAAKLSIPANTIRQRLNLGWTAERALTEPIGQAGGSKDIKATRLGKEYRQ